MDFRRCRRRCGGLNKRSSDTGCGIHRSLTRHTLSLLHGSLPLHRSLIVCRCGFLRNILTNHNNGFLFLRRFSSRRGCRNCNRCCGRFHRRFCFRFLCRLTFRLFGFLRCLCFGRFLCCLFLGLLSLFRGFILCGCTAEFCPYHGNFFFTDFLCCRTVIKSFFS